MTAIRVGDRFATQNCRLYRIMRKELHRWGVAANVEVVYSGVVIPANDCE